MRLIVLDFTSGECFIYSVVPPKEPPEDYCETIIENQGHNLNNCQWMLTNTSIKVIAKGTLVHNKQRGNKMNNVNEACTVQSQPGNVSKPQALHDSIVDMRGVTAQLDKLIAAIKGEDTCDLPSDPKGTECSLAELLVEGPKILDSLRQDMQARIYTLRDILL